MIDAAACQEQGGSNRAFLKGCYDLNCDSSSKAPRSTALGWLYVLLHLGLVNKVFWIARSLVPPRDRTTCKTEVQECKNTAALEINKESTGTA
jgi:hypothetical protein